MVMLTPASVRDLLACHDLRPSKALGQHFLADGNTARRIVRLSGVDAGDRVLEIGPGIGSLTLALLERGARVVALEVDRHLVGVLEEVVAGVGPGEVEIVRGDALTVDWQRLLGGDTWSCVSNLPYNVATPVVMRLLEECPEVTRLLVMVQREVGERLAAAPGTDGVRCGVGEDCVLHRGPSGGYGSAYRVRARPSRRLGARSLRTSRDASRRRAVARRDVHTRARGIRAAAQDAATRAAARAR